MTIEQCPVISIDEASKELTLYSALEKNDFVVRVDDMIFDLVIESDEQVYLSVDLENKSLVE